MKSEWLTAKSGVPVLIWGPPGIGKTAKWEQAAKAAGIGCETVILSICEPSDVGGLPVAGEQATRRLIPDWFGRLAVKPGLLLLDELTTCPPALQAAALRLVQSRAIGSVRLHPQTMIAACANPPEEAAGGWELAPPMANRFAHFKWSFNFEEWADWMATASGVDGAAVAAVLGFIRARPALGHAMPKEESARGLAWPSPRSWHAAAVALAAHAGAGLDAAEAVAGCVGEGAALEFLTWRKAADLPNAEDLMSGKAQLPKRDDALFAVLGAVAGAVAGKPSADRWRLGAAVVAKAAAGGRADVGAPAARALVRSATACAVAMAEAGKLLSPYADALKAAGVV